MREGVNMNSNALKAQIMLKGIKVDELLIVLKSKYSVRMSKSAFYRKLNGTSEFDRREILAISEALCINDDKMMDIFFREKVS
jgi:hypothetical protein